MKPRCLIIRYGGLGDVIQVSSLFAPLSQQYRLWLDTSEIGEQMCRHDPHLSGILVTPHGSVKQEEWATYWNARGNGFDRVINLSEAVEWQALALPEQLGFWHDAPTRRRLFGRINYVEHLHLIAGVDAPPGPRYYPTQDEYNEAAALLPQPDWPLYGLCLAGSTFYKVWPHLPALALRLLAREPRAHLVLLGAAKDETLAQQLREHVVSTLGEAVGPRVITVVQQPLRLALAIAGHCDALVGPETGILNAMCMEPLRKVVLLSHSAAHQLTRDWANTRALSPAPEAAPCHPCHRLHQSRDTCTLVGETFAACAAGISPDAVLAALG